MFILIICKISRLSTFTISLWRIPLCCDLLSRRIDQKNFPLRQQLTELHWLFDGLYNNVFPQILNSKAIGKRYALQANAQN